MFLVIATAPLLLVSALTFTNYKNSLETNRISQLQDLTIFRADRIETYFAGLKAHIKIAQGFYNIKKNLPVLTRLADDPNNPEFLAAKKMLDEQLHQMRSVSDLTDIMLVNPEGKVVYANKPGHYSKDISNGLDAEQKAFSQGKDRVYFSDVYFDKAEDNRFEMLLTAPAFDFNGAFIGVIAFEVDMTPAYRLIQDTIGLGETGEVLLGKKTGNQIVYLNPLRHEPNAVLIRRIDIGGEIGRPIQEAVQGKTGAGQYLDYRGKKVIAAWRYIPSLDWGMVAKIDAEEAFADVKNLRNLATIILVIVIVLSSITAFSIAQSISEPIKRLSDGTAIIGSGNLDYKLGTNQKDEIGQLSRTFDKMTSDLKQTTTSRDELNREIAERKQAEEALRKSRDELEMRVKERTADLDETVSELQTQVEQRIKAEETVKAERKRFEDVLEMMPAYAVLLTPDYHVAYTNRTFRDWFGDDNGRKCYEFLFNRKEPCETCETYTVLKTGKSHFWEWTGPNGRNYDIYDYPFTDTDGSPLIMEIGVDVTAHKQAQKAVRQGEERYRSLTVATTQIVWTTDAQGQVAGDLPSWRAFTGQSIEAIQRWGWINALHPDDRDRTAKIWTQSVKNKILYETEYRLKQQDGNYRYMSVRGVPVLEQDGSIREWVGTCTDITERKQAEEALRSTSLYARGLLEASLDPLVTISADGKITDVNEATIKVTGVPREQLIGTDFSDYFTEPEKAREGYKKVFDEGFVTDYPLTIRHRNGRLTDVLYNATVYKNEAGEVQGVFAAARDVTERKRAERRQRVINSLLELFAKKTTRKSYLDSAVEAIRDWSGCEFVGIRVRDNEGNIPYESYVGFDKDFLALENALHLDRDKCVCIRAILENPQQQEQNFMSAGGSFYCNDSLAFLNGLSEQQKKEYRGNCIKRGFQSIAVIPIRYRDEVLGAIHLADYKKDMVLLPKIQFIETTVSPLIGEAINRFNAETELEKYRLHLEDLVKQRTEELARSNKDLEQFAYVASHDLQEPLRAVSGFVGLLKHHLEGTLDDKKTEYMNFAIDGVTRMQALINGLLEYSRVDTRGKPPESTDSRAVLEQALLDLQASIKESGAKVTADHLPTVNVDPVQLVQLFTNLIGNAIKFRSDRPPEIKISASRQDSSWKFAVSDNGIGIEPQYTECIFLIFQRLHTRKKYPGTGIGLSICKKIVERHGGKIWVESKPENGSTFYFTLP
jgi:PAS domain S-box-containing protein